MTRPVSRVTLADRCLLYGMLIPVLSLPGYAGFRIQQLLEIPALPGQRVVETTTDSHGNLVVTAYVSSDTLGPSGLIKKIDTAGNEIFSRFLPGVISVALAVDGNDDIYVVGTTLTPSAFPFTNQLTGFGQGETNGIVEKGFIMKLRGPDGTIAYSTSWGGGITSYNIAVDGSGHALVATSTFGPLLPTTPGAYSSPAGGNLTSLMYLVLFSAAGDSVIFSARYGGQTSICTSGSSCSGAAQVTMGSRILLDRQGNIWIAGTTNTTDLPVTSDALKKTCGCSEFSGDGFLARFSSDGSRLLYATYIGTSPASNLDSDGNDVVTAAAADSVGHVWIAGYTNGSDFPVTANAAQKQLAGGTDGFIAEYDPSTNHLLYATYFGGSGDDSIANILIEPAGTVIFSGHSTSATLPAAVTGFARGNDFVAAIDPIAYVITGLTKFPNGSTGMGLALTPNGFVLSGVSNVVAFLETGDNLLPSVYGVTNSGGTAVIGQVAPGELISLYGANLGPPMPVTADLRSGQAPFLLGGIQVLVDGVPAPVLYAQSDQINAIVPFGVSSVTHIAVGNASAKSNDALLGVVAASPEAFKTSPRLWAAALNQDGTVNNAGNHAKLGSIVSVFATGFGGLTPQPRDGQAITGMLPALGSPVEVLYQGQPLTVTYAGPAPTLVAGVMQVNFQLPAFTGTSEPRFQFLVGGWLSGDFVVLVR